MAGTPFLRTQEHEVQQPISFFTAVGILVAFRNKQLNLDEEIFEVCFDVICGLLEDVNNEKYRLQNRKPITPES